MIPIHHFHYMIFDCLQVFSILFPTLNMRCTIRYPPFLFVCLSIYIYIYIYIYNLRLFLVQSVHFSFICHRIRSVGSTLRCVSSWTTLARVMDLPQLRTGRKLLSCSLKRYVFLCNLFYFIFCYYILKQSDLPNQYRTNKIDRPTL